MRARSSPRSTRRGVMAPAYILGMTVLVLVVMILIHHYYAQTVGSQLQASLDAAALAGVAALADDRALTGDPTVLPELEAAARLQVQRYASRNPVRGWPLNFQLSTAADTGDILLLGRVEAQEQGTGLLVPSDQERGSLPPGWFNAVTVIVHREARIGGSKHGRGAKATAYVDRALIGFRPRDEPIPLIPVGLPSDPTGTDTNSWESQVLRSNGIVVVLLPQVPGAAADLTATARLVPIGEPADGLADQFRRGVTAADLASFPEGRFLATREQPALLPAWSGMPSSAVGDDGPGEWLAELAQSGRPRIWPLYASTDAVAGSVHIVGFVAARLTQIQATDNGILLTLQPCQLFTAAAVTSSSSQVEENRYIGRIRLVQVSHFLQRNFE